MLLKQLREKSGLAQKDIAAKLGYATPQFISNWERGLSTPPINTLKTLGKLYNCNPDDLFQALLSSEVELLKASMIRRYKGIK